MHTEKSVRINFDGFDIDLFTTETGKLGMTIERNDGLTYVADNPSIDLFIDRKTLSVTGQVNGNGNVWDNVETATPAQAARLAQWRRN